jgi:phosphinothricin acetyltransferase
MSGTLRMATSSDAPAIQRIYAPYVEETSITFETTVPAVETVEAKLSETLRRDPWLVCERDDGVVGYAYAGPLRERDAYRWAVELSVYVDSSAQRESVGYTLYDALLALLTAQGYASTYGGVTLPNPASVALHERCGFEHVGTFPDVGYKHGDWHDVGWWRRRLTAPAAPDPPRPIDTLDDAVLREALAG